MIRLLAMLVTMAQPAATPTCLPAYWGGILAGLTNRLVVEKIYGRGIYLPDEGGVPATYYRDNASTVTVHVEYGTDELVERIEIMSGNAIPQALAADPHAVSGSLRAPFVFGAWGAISLGASLADVRSNMGVPQEEQKSPNDQVTLVYKSTCSCELPAGISFTFRAQHLVKVSYWQDLG